MKRGSFMIDSTDMITDERLVLLYKQGSQEAFNQLLQKYTPMIYYYSNKYFANGLLNGDLFQEGCIGLYAALTRYQESKGTFNGLANVYIKNNIINAIKTATRKKHQILNRCMSLYSDNNDSNSDASNLMSWAVDAPTPEELYLKKEEMTEKHRDLIHFLRSMPRIEQLVCIEIVSGKSYKEAADNIGLSPKSIDNAIRRIKKKALEKVG
jgi:RNA polymerase sporulation-specific sigma factor